MHYIGYLAYFRQCPFEIQLAEGPAIIGTLLQQACPAALNLDAGSQAVAAWHYLIDKPASLTQIDAFSNYRRVIDLPDVLSDIVMSY